MGNTNLPPRCAKTFPLLWVLLSLCAAGMLGITGCRAPVRDAPRGYFGPTESIHAVVQKVNANNEQIPTLRGAGDFEAWIKEDPNGKTQFVNGELTLLYSRPHSMRLIGKKDVMGSIFEIASNDERYWMIVRPPDNAEHLMWWGTHANAANVDPKKIPVRPDLVLEVLGLQTLSTNLLEPPMPVMRFNNDKDAYMVVWHERLPDRLVALKEIWYDRVTLRPKLVLLFDANGRIVLRAYLSNHKPLEVPGVAPAEWPDVATRYELLFPDTGSKMIIRLVDDVALKRNNAPNPRSFLFPEDPGVSRVIPIDEPAAP